MNYSNILFHHGNICIQVIADFIPCGNVLLKIREPNNIIKKLVLQSTKCEIPLVLSTERMEVSLTLTIEGLNVTYEKVLNIINPSNNKY